MSDWLLLIVWSVPIVIVVVTLLVVLRGAPYVPSRSRDVRAAFDDLYSLGKNDVLLDLGSGDGTVLRLAAERQARAIGYEINPFLVVLSRWLCRKYLGVSIRMVDMWLTSVPAGTTVIYVFATSRDINKIMQWTQRQATSINRPLYVISYGFKADIAELRSHGAHHLYLVEPLQGDKPQV